MLQAEVIELSMPLSAAIADATDGPACWCGKPSRRGGGWCGECGEDAPKCGHGFYLGTYECADCVGQMTEDELRPVRHRLRGHEGCVPGCDRAPTAETARLMATIDAFKSEIGTLKDDADALRVILADVSTALDAEDEPFERMPDIAKALRDVLWVRNAQRSP